MRPGTMFVLTFYCVAGYKAGCWDLQGTFKVTENILLTISINCHNSRFYNTF